MFADRSQALVPAGTVLSRNQSQIAFDGTKRLVQLLPQGIGGDQQGDGRLQLAHLRGHHAQQFLEGTQQGGVAHQQTLVLGPLAASAFRRWCSALSGALGVLPSLPRTRRSPRRPGDRSSPATPRFALNGAPNAPNQGSAKPPAATAPTATQTPVVPVREPLGLQEPIRASSEITQIEWKLGMAPLTGFTAAPVCPANPNSLLTPHVPQSAQSGLYHRRHWSSPQFRIPSADASPDRRENPNSTRYA